MKSLPRCFALCAALSVAMAAPALAADAAPAAQSVMGYALTGLSVVLAVAALPIAFYAVKFAAKLAEGVGLSVDATMKAALQQQVVNGLNWAAAEAAKHGTTLDKTSAIGKALEYVRAHGADIVKGLGLDPASKHFAESVSARAEKALNDPNTPTPEAITSPVGMPPG